MASFVRVEFRNTLRDLKAVGDQVPFATALALTRLAKDSQREIRKRFPRRFIKRRSWIPKGVRIIKATPETQTSFVYSKDRWMADQEFGGIRRARKKLRGIPTGVRRSKRSVVPTARRPAALLAQNRRRYFLEKVGDKVGLYEKRGKRGMPRQLYLMVPRVRVRPRWRFGKTVEAVVRHRYVSRMRGAWRYATRTAR